MRSPKSLSSSNHRALLLVARLNLPFQDHSGSPRTISDLPVSCTECLANRARGVKALTIKMPHKGFSACLSECLQSYLLFRPLFYFSSGGICLIRRQPYAKKKLLSPQPLMSSANSSNVENGIDGIIWCATFNHCRLPDLWRTTKFHFGGTIFQIAGLCGELRTPECSSYVMD